MNGSGLPLGPASSHGAGEEFEILRRIEASLPGPPRGEVWMGDDAAVIGNLVVTSDAVVAGVHVDLSVAALDDFGWKSVAVNVSDVAAMGCLPRYAVVAIAAPADTDIGLLYEGIAAAAREYGCAIIGGDLANSPTLVVTVTLIGYASAKGVVLRSGGKSGDTLFVTGPLGSSAAGLRELRDGKVGDAASAYRRPRAQVAAGLAANLAGATAMIDISDGFTSDLTHLGDASGLGLSIDDVPVAPSANENEALNGGEDYELIIATPDPSALMTVFEASNLRAPIRVGLLTDNASERKFRGATLRPQGFQHQWRL